MAQFGWGWERDLTWIQPNYQRHSSSLNKMSPGVRNALNSEMGHKYVQMATLALVDFISLNTVILFLTGIFELWPRLTFLCAPQTHGLNSKKKKKGRRFVQICKKNKIKSAMVHILAKTSDFRHFCLQSECNFSMDVFLCENKLKLEHANSLQTGQYCGVVVSTLP